MADDVTTNGSARNTGVASHATAPDHRLRVMLRRYLPVALAVAIGVGLTVAGVLVVQHGQRAGDRAELERRTGMLAATLQRSLDGHQELLPSIDVLRSFFASASIEESLPVAEPPLRRFVRRAQDRHPGLDALGWAVAAAGAEPSIRDAASLIDSDIGDGRPAAPVDRFPVLYAEPHEDAHLAIGINLGADATQREALERARDTGAYVASGLISLVDDGGVYAGLLLVLPLYDRTQTGGIDPSTVAGRRAALAGLLVASVNIDRLVESALEGIEHSGVGMRLVDISDDPGGGETLQTIDWRETVREENRRRDYASSILSVADRRWRLDVAPTGGRPGVHDVTAWGVAGGGLAITSLLAVYLATAINRSGRIARLAADLERESIERGRSEARFRSLVQNASDVVIVLDDQGIVRYASPSIERVFGLRADAAVGEHAVAWIHPDDASALEPLFAGMLDTPGLHPPVRLRLRDAAGAWRIVETVANNLRHEPSVQGIVQTVRDITAAVQADEEVRRAERRYRQLFEDAPVMYAITRDLDGHPLIVDCNELFLRTLGYDRAEVIGHRLEDFYSSEGRALLLDAGGYQRALQGRFTTEERQLCPRSGGTIETLLRAVPETDAEGRVVGTRAMFVDITDRKVLEEQLRYQAFHDTLTGLANRALFLDRLGHALISAERHGAMVAVLLLDLDGFKLINDSYGHPAGDALVVAVGQRLEQCLHPDATVARLGGDEFAIVLDVVASATEAMRTAEAILRALREPFDTDVTAATELYVTTSIGVAVSAEATVETLVQHADIALYQAKAAGKARAILFEPAMTSSVVARWELGNDLRRALTRDEFRVVYQPEVDLSSGAVVGVEALLRWRHPTRGEISPGEFIPVAEETGLILPLGRWVLWEACRTAHEWQALRPAGEPLVVSVNLSARQLAQGDALGEIRSVLQATGLSPGCLRLEITESAMMEDVEAAIGTLQALKSLGLKLAIDDFGTGYSSLSYLRRFPVDAVKVDRSFVADLDHDLGAEAIMRAVVTLARTLDMEVTAEGIETAEQLERVQALQYDRGQGYYLAMPLPPEELPRLLRAESPVPCVVPQPDATGRSAVRSPHGHRTVQ